MKSEIPPRNVFKVYLTFLKTSIDILEAKYHSNEINDIKSYQVIILKRIHQSMSTLEVMLTQCEDPISSYGLLRVIVDSVCSYCFIYDNDDKVEVEFRHYLYLLDGCTKYNEFCHREFPNDLSHSKSVNKQYEIDTYQSSKEMIYLQDCIKKLLFKHCYMSKFPIMTNKIINAKEWKYKCIDSKENYEYYNWRELYEKVGCDKNMSDFILSFLSQFVHGLFLSNTKNPNSIVHYSLIYNMLIILLKKLLKVLSKIFKEGDFSILFFKNIDYEKIAESVNNRELIDYLKNS